MRSRTTKYLLIGYLVKTLVLGIVWVLVPESRDWARAFTAPIFALVGCGGDRNPKAASPQ